MHISRSDLTQLFCLWLLLFMGLLGIGLYGNSPQSIYFTNDAASTMAVAQGALSGELPLAGPPAARGGRHFGPWYFYWQTVFLGLSGGSIENAILLETIGKCFFLSLGTLLFLFSFLRSSQLSFAVFGAFLSFLCGSWWWLLRTPWHSNYVASLGWFLPLIVVFLIEKGMLSRAIVFFASSLTLQAHLATAPMVLWAGCITLILPFLIRFQKKTGVRFSASSQAFFWSAGVLSWIPTLIYSLRFPDGLLGSEANTNINSPREGLPGAALFSLRVLKRYTVGEVPWTSLLSPLRDSSAFLVACLFVFLAVSLLLLAFRQWTLEGKTKGASLLALFLAYTMAIAVLRRPVHLHYENSLLFLFPVFFGLVLHQACSLLLKPNSNYGRVLAIAFLALSLPIFFRAGMATVHVLSSLPFASQNTLAHAREFSEVLHEQSFSPVNDSILINETEKYRESALLLFLGRSYFPLMQYAKSFRELPSFQSSPTRNPNRVWLVSCESLPDRQARRYLKNMEPADEVPLSSCESCQSCTLRRWKKRLSGVEVPDRSAVEPLRHLPQEEETAQGRELPLQD